MMSSSAALLVLMAAAVSAQNEGPSMAPRAVRSSKEVLAMVTDVDSINVVGLDHVMIEII